MPSFSQSTIAGQGGDKQLSEMQLADIHSIGFNPELPTPVPGVQQAKPEDREVDLIVVHEETRPRNHYFIDKLLDKAEFTGKLKEAQSKGFVYNGENTLTVDMIEPPFKPKAYICRFKGKWGELKAWIDDGRYRTWSVGFSTAAGQTTLEDDMSKVKDDLVKSARFGEIVEVKWEQLKQER
jgi:hypothetical protein